jgi:site-specific DNA-methyltransferase (adenine-specific)
VSTTLHHGNCLDVLAQYPADYFDITVTDLPYAEETHKGVRTTASSGTGRKENGGAVLVDFPSITFTECRTILAAAGRVTRRWVISTLDYRHCARLEQEPPDGLNFIRFGVWTKPNGTPQLTGDRPAAGWEAVAILHRPGKKRWNGGGLPAVWNTPTCTGSNLYPTQKPLPLLRSFVSLFSDGSGPVLDPCCGSGGVGVVCAEKGLPFVGIDLRAEAIERARARIDATSRQGDMFTAPVKAIPQDLFGADP